MDKGTENGRTDFKELYVINEYISNALNMNYSMINVHRLKARSMFNNKDKKYKKHYQQTNRAWAGERLKPK